MVGSTERELGAVGCERTRPTVERPEEARADSRSHTDVEPSAPKSSAPAALVRAVRPSGLIMNSVSGCGCGFAGSRSAAPILLGWSGSERSQRMSSCGLAVTSRVGSFGRNWASTMPEPACRFGPAGRPVWASNTRMLPRAVEEDSGHDHAVPVGTEARDACSDVAAAQTQGAYDPPDATSTHPRLPVIARGDEAPPVRADVRGSDPAGDRDQTLEAGRHVRERRLGARRRRSPTGRAGAPRRRGGARAELVGGERRRLRREPSQLRGPGPVAGLAPLDEGEAPGCDRHHQQHGGRREGAEPTRSVRGAELGIVRGARRREEVPLEPVGFARVTRRPVERGREPCAAVQLGRVATRGLPLGCAAARWWWRRRPSRSSRATRGTWPLPEERLVCDLDAVGARRHEPAVGEGPEHLGGAEIVGGDELVRRNAATYVVVALARLGESQQDPSARLTLVGAELLVDALGEMRQCAGHASRVS